MFVHVGVKRWKRQPAELYGISVLVFAENDVGPRFLVLQLNFVAHELDVFPAGRIGRVSRDDEQVHVSPFFAANHFDDFVEPHFANIDKLILALPDSGDSVAYFEPPVYLRRPAGNKAFNFSVAILGAKHGPDSYERKAHVNAEIFHVGLAQILGVGVVRFCERIEKKLHLLVLVLLMDVARKAIVAAGNQLRSWFDRVLAQMFL